MFYIKYNKDSMLYVYHKSVCAEHKPKNLSWSINGVLKLHIRVEAKKISVAIRNVGRLKFELSSNKTLRTHITFFVCLCF